MLTHTERETMSGTKVAWYWIRSLQLRKQETPLCLLRSPTLPTLDNCLGMYANWFADFHYFSHFSHFTQLSRHVSGRMVESSCSFGSLRSRCSLLIVVRTGEWSNGWVTSLTLITLDCFLVQVYQPYSRLKQYLHCEECRNPYHHRTPWCCTTRSERVQPLLSRGVFLYCQSVPCRKPFCMKIWRNKCMSNAGLQRRKIWSKKRWLTPGDAGKPI